MPYECPTCHRDTTAPPFRPDPKSPGREPGFSLCEQLELFFLVANFISLLNKTVASARTDLEVQMNCSACEVAVCACVQVLRNRDLPTH